MMITINPIPSVWGFVFKLLVCSPYTPDVFAQKKFTHATISKQNSSM